MSPTRREKRPGTGPAPRHRAVPAPRAPGDTPSGERSAPRHALSPRLRARAYPPGTRLPALTAAAVLAAACAVGSGFLLYQLFGHARAFPAATVLAAALGLATLAFGFWILRRIRPGGAPDTPAAAVAVATGLTAATSAGIIANGGLGALWSTLLGLEFSGVWGASLTAPLNEELLKLSGIVLVALVFPHALRTPVDGFVLGALLGLGFEVTENLIYALQSVTWSGATDPVLTALQSTVARVGLTGLGSHWAMSAVAGTAVGLLAAADWRPSRRRATGAALLVLLAIGQHWLLDAPFLQGSVPLILVKVLLIFAAAMAVYAAARTAHLRRVRRTPATDPPPTPE
ncbi:PrsW family intramembrane metalloprotease [Nocardiopsis sp. CNT312]|uniref:PrsW family intramembrane metalloprotease n=1 Tax=Nocardiopsis sp. CNT312 TaxID=1137268 RepID=UPI0004BB4760|nr:PrsW family intramembrane metalloprotease [Nocardiopsis sp. CNT312]